jgi:hypothetical protein
LLEGFVFAASDNVRDCHKASTWLWRQPAGLSAADSLFHG